MIVFIVSRDHFPIWEEPFATQNGAESFVRICKGIDRKDKVKHTYDIDATEGKLIPRNNLSTLDF